MNVINYQKEMCTGCGLCHSLYENKIDRDDKGFAVPCVNKENLEQLKNICPINSYEKEDTFSVWGNYISVYEGWSNDENVRKNASSGGAITALAIYLLESRKVDGVIHVGESDVDHQKTEVRTSTSKEDVIKNLGSRYCISTPLYDILDRIEKGKKYAFIGKPCDVAAVKNGMNVNETLRDAIVFTISFFCAGTPSDVANRLLLEKLGAKDKTISSFRYRGNGWPGYATAIDSDGNEYSMTYGESWGRVLGRDVKRVCRYCLDGIGLYADVACADLWYLKEDGQPDFSEHDGRNIIFSRSPYGDKVVKEAFDCGYIYVADYVEKLADFNKQQPHQFSRRTTMKYRILPVKLSGRMAPKYSKRYMNRAKSFASIKERYEAFIGSVKRVIKGRV